MFRVKVARLRQGLGPNQVICSIQTLEGPVQVELHEHSLRKDFGIDTVGVGYPVGYTPDGWLVELPAETVDGKWRVYVKPEELTPVPKPKSYPAAAQIHA